MSRFDREVLEVVRQPRAAFSGLAERRAPVGGLFAVMVLAAGYSTFCLLLWVRGQVPGRAGAFGLIPVEDYYLAQAIFLPLLFPVLWVVLAGTVHRFARAMGGRGAYRSALATLGFAYAVPLLLGYVLPDLLVFLALGFDAMLWGTLIYGPLALIWTLVLCTLATRTTYSLGWRAAMVSAFAGLVAQGIIGGLFIR